MGIGKTLRSQAGAAFKRDREILCGEGSDREFAEKIGITADELSKIEAGDMEVSENLFHRMMKRLGSNGKYSWQYEDKCKRYSGLLTKGE
jgi:transcriptional regulator with XRE-family HTH domain